ncbi:galactoside alpha-(1,2)-fucosyltransferase 2-like isoform X2 [Ambystoma mexicanum]|uniref:galactoside alpha-(1,2)-fucosyltransferase 2-like isoform X2 n=1 Tax=Ambystoma mexicanum TaxID=8296 RepID=UPI0037E7DA56
MGVLAFYCSRRKITTSALIIFSVLGVCSICINYYLTSQWTTPCLNCFIYDKASMSTAPNTVNVSADGIWTIDSLGRLGNQMSEYATLFALAKMNGRQAYILPRMFNILAPLFKINLPVLPDAVAKSIKWRNYPLRLRMSDEYKHIEGQYVKFTGYPVSYTYFFHIKDEIHNEFMFHSAIREDAYGSLLKLKGQRQNATYIGVHIRRGDYAAYMSRRWNGVIAGKGYVEKAIGYFRKKYPEPVFVVVSNDMQWCKKNIDASRGDVYFSGDGIESSPERDFALLSHCNHSIMTLGTFGIWSSYLAGGETIYLTNFSLPGPDAKPFPYDSLYRPDWIGFPADLSPILPTIPSSV